MLAQIGNSMTVSLGMNSNKVSLREYSPPIPAVININPTETMPILECRMSTSPPHFLRSRMPTARPAEVIDSNSLLAKIGLSIPSLGTAFTPLIIANGVAIKPPSKAQWATAVSYTHLTLPTKRIV